VPFVLAQQTSNERLLRLPIPERWLAHASEIPIGFDEMLLRAQGDLGDRS